MYDIFGFPEVGVFQPYYNISSFWHELTRGDSVCEGQVMSSVLIKDHSYLIIHKFMAHPVIGIRDRKCNEKIKIYSQTRTWIYAIQLID